MKDRKFLRIVKGAMKGDEEAFTRLMQLRSRNILYIAMNIMRDRSAGEDIAQDVAASMQRDISKLQHPEAFDSWMYRTVYNACMNEKKKMARTQDYKELDDQVENMVVEERSEFLPEAYVDSDEKQKEVLQAISELPDKYRLCVLLFYYEEMDYKEIADVMEIKVQDVANHLSRAKRRLRQQLVAGKAEESFSPSKSLSKNTGGAISSIPIVTQVLRVDERVAVTPTMVDRFIATVGAPAATGVGAAVAGSALGVGAGGVISAAIGTLKRVGVVKLALPVAAAVVIAGGVYLATVVVPSEQNIVPLMEDQSKSSSFVEEGKKASEGEGESGDGNEDASHNAATLSPEELADKTGLNDKQAEDLNSYTDGGKTEDEWDKYVKEAKLYYHGQTIDANYQYNVYLLDDPEAESLLISIERSDNAGSVEVAYRVTDSEGEIPQGIGIIEAFDAWK